MSNKKAIAIKRISNDIRELQKCPLEGIGMASIENNPMEYVINMELMMGLYQGYKLQLKMTIPDEYPIKPPKVLIYPGQMLNSEYHHHIFGVLSGYKRFCIDFLDNEYQMNTNEEHTGWNPAYTISTILLQIQNFISNPDLPSYRIPKKDKIQLLMKSMDDYTRNFTDDEGKKVVHSWKNPYPKMFYMSTKMDVEEKENNQKNERKMQIIKENLTCYMLRDNYIDNPEILLGYPIIRKTSEYGNNKIELYPIPELLSYEAYTIQTGKDQDNQNALIGAYYNQQVKAANNQYYNNWLPIYVDENHFGKNKETILNSLKAIKNESEFKPEQIFDILPIILNKMIIGMFKGKSIISSAFIKSYFHYILLFKRLCQEYKEEYEAYVNKKINLITMNDYEINKKIIPDIGDFFILTFMSNKDMTTPEMKKMKKVLIEEFVTREMYWTFHGPECSTIMKEKLVKNSLKISDEQYLDMFHTDPNLKMRYLDIFNKELHRLNIYSEIINLIANDYDYLYNNYNDWKYGKRIAEERITTSFKSLYNEVSDWTRNRIKEKIKDKMRFKEFFEEDEKEIKRRACDSFRVDEILRGNESMQDIKQILEFAFQSQRGNQLLIITFYALKKIEENGFMEELEKTYGIYLGVDEFVKELKKKLQEINNYGLLHEYVGVELDKEKTELDIVVEAYQRAKQKRYIRDPNEKNNVNEYRRDNRGGRGRGRGRAGGRGFRGYGRGQYW